MRNYLTPLERNFRISASSPDLPTSARVEAIERMKSPSEQYLLRLLKSGKGKKVRGKKAKPLPVRLRFAVAKKLDDLQQELHERRTLARYQDKKNQ